jgi:uncharacterized protein YqjF (DUF2071 family)
MNWLSPLFVHWPIAPEKVRPLIPSSLEIDTFDNQAWLTALPFRMAGSRLRYTPALPWLSNFLELNVRTYVRFGETGGVWLLGAEVANPIVARGARLFLDMPFYCARMSCVKANGGLRYSTQRAQRGAPPAQFIVEYRPVGPVYQVEPGTLDDWLTERYCVYSTDRKGRLMRGDIHHIRWPLQQVEAEIQANTLLATLGLNVSQTPSLLHYSPGVAVVAWLPKAIL